MERFTKGWLIVSLLMIVVGLTGAVREQVNTSSSQTLTNKTLTAPAISAPTFSGTAAGSLTNLALTTPTFTGNTTITNTSLPVLRLNTTHGSNFASQIQFNVSGTSKFIIAEDINQAGVNDLTFYDGVNALARLVIGATGVITIPNGSLSGATIASPVFSGTATGTYTLAGTPTIGSNLTITTASTPLLRLNTTHGSNFASQIQFLVGGTIKYRIAADIDVNGTNDLTFYDAAAVAARLKIESTGNLNVFSNDITAIDELAFTDATANATAAGRLRRNGTTLTWHDGTTANVLRPTLATPQASTSGTSIDFTGIPAGTRRITIMFVGVSTNGTDDMWVQIGDAGGIEETGYLGAKSTLAASVSTVRITTAFGIDAGSTAAAVRHGTVILTLENAAAFTWVQLGHIARSDADFTYWSAGSKSLSAELDRVRITTGGAVNTFDAGAINIVYE